MSLPRVAVCDFCGLAPPRGLRVLRILSGIHSELVLHLCLNCREWTENAIVIAINESRDERVRASRMEAPV